MIKIHNLGFPRIGPKRELKFALEKYWNGKSDETELVKESQALLLDNLHRQANLDYQPIGDFSLYDHVLDHNIMFGNVASRFVKQDDSELQQYFRIARGRAPQDSDCKCTAAGEMTKWYDTNYHYIVPEFSQDTQFSLFDKPLIRQIHQARSQGFNVKPVILGPISYLLLGKAKDQVEPLSLLEDLLPCYQQLIKNIARCGVEWVQIDEPALVTELSPEWQNAYNFAYQCLSQTRVKLLLATYFGELAENGALAAKLPVDGLHIDAVRGRGDVEKVLSELPKDKVLSLGVIDGRNIWKTDLNSVLDWIEPIARELEERLWLAPSCSLLHVPVDLNSELSLDPDLKNWLAFATQKLAELALLGKAVNFGRQAVASELIENAQAIASRQQSQQVHNTHVKQAIANISSNDYQRQTSFEERHKLQQSQLNLPLYPTTTIGSFPQTQTIRQIRRQYKQGDIQHDDYIQSIRTEIADCIKRQEELGLDVLVHGEAERNDMVEYFGELLDGIAFSQFGWVQSYGSRCVKPPIIFGDVSRSQSMTVEWTNYAQSLTQKPLKGMLTGPVTILNWSFVRDDQERAETCQQIALAIRDEVLELEASGTKLIQIDEAALREGLPLRKSQWSEYLTWAIDSFRLSANGVADQTQIHTHMCYSDFNDIIESIARLDADVISIETSRSDMELLDAFNDFNYPNDIGPGVYDIHSPNIPTEQSIIYLLQRAAEKLPEERIWINPDCGLKTRRWEEVIPALKNMVNAAKTLRQKSVAA